MANESTEINGILRENTSLGSGDVLTLIGNLQVAEDVTITVDAGAIIDLGGFELLNFGIINLSGETGSFALMRNGSYSTENTQGMLSSSYGHISNLTIDGFFSDGSILISDTYIENSSIDALKQNTIKNSLFSNSPFDLGIQKAEISESTFLQSKISALAWHDLFGDRTTTIDNTNFINDTISIYLDPFFSSGDKFHDFSISDSYIHTSDNQTIDDKIYDANDDLQVITNIPKSSFSTIPYTNHSDGFAVASVLVNKNTMLIEILENSNSVTDSSDPTVSIYSNASVNLTDLDMSRLANYSSTTFHDNVSYSVFGNIYSDVLEVYWELEGTNYLTAFGGPIIEVDGDAITGGTVTGFIEYYWNGAEWFPFLGVDGFSVSAKELYQTVGTTDTSDEYAIFTAALSGDDVFYLSDYDETVNGYAGNDVIDGGKGNDIINGGDGNDIISGGDGNDIINDGKGYDTIDGGKGIDTFKRDYSTDYGENAFNAHINLDLGTISSADYPEDTPDYIQNIENVTLEGQFNYTVTGDSNDNEILTSSGEDVIISGVGKDLIGSAASNDTITLTGNTTHDGKFAHNVGSTTDVATNVELDLNGKVKLETVVDGGAGNDTVNLSSSGDAFFLHDSFSGFHSSLTLTTDTHTGGQSTQRILNAETINGLDGDDIIDLTSPDYSLAGQVITINGGTGNDVIWGSDATETLIGGDGNDILFGGSGNDTLTGGLGADTFEFTVTAGNDTITDYSKSDGDVLKIYRRDQYEGDQEATISAGVVTFGSVTIDLGDTSLTSLDLLNVEYAII